MIEFKDEILNGEPRYRVRDIDGNLIHDNAAIEMSTPVVQQGTPLNKPFFENIQAYIKSTDRYNPVRATINTTIDGEYRKNFFEGEWTQIASGQYQSGKKIVTNDPEWDYPSYLAFDGDASTWAGEKRSNTSFSKTLHLDYGEEIKVTEFYLSIGIYIDTGSIKLQASKDNATWVDIATFTDEETTKYNVKVSDPDWYRYYRIYSTSGYNYYGIYELQTVTAIIHQTQVLESDLRLDTYDADKMINIKTPADFDETANNNYININRLGDKLINAKYIKADSEYTLKYNGENFDITPAEVETNTKSVSLAITSSSGGTLTKNMKIYVGDARTIILCFSGSWSRDTTLSGLMFIDMNKSKKLLGIGNRRYIKYEVTSSAEGALQANETTQPIAMSVGLDSTTYLAMYNYNDTYGRQTYAYVSVGEISLSDGVLTIPLTIHGNSRQGAVNATVYGFASVIN